MTAGAFAAAEARARAAAVPEVVVLRGAGAEVGARLRGLFEADRAARLELARLKRMEGTPKLWAGGAIGVAAIGAALAGWPLALLGLLAAVPLVVAGETARSEGTFYANTLITAHDAQVLLADLLPDLHPHGPADLRLDRRQADHPANLVRTEKSPESGRSKAYYRHVYLTLRGPLADGSPLVLEVARLLKTRDRLHVASRLELRGRMAPRRGRFAGERRFGALTILGAEHDGRAELVFWGSFHGPHELVAALRDLGQALAGRPA